MENDEENLLVKIIELFVIVVTAIVLIWQNFMISEQSTQMIGQTYQLIRQNKNEVMPIIAADTEKSGHTKNIGKGAAINVFRFHITNTSSVKMFSGNILALGPGDSISDSGLDRDLFSVTSEDFNNLFNNKIDLNDLFYSTSTMQISSVLISRYRDVNKNCYASIYLFSNSVSIFSFKDLGECDDYMPSVIMVR